MCVLPEAGRAIYFPASRHDPARNTRYPGVAHRPLRPGHFSTSGDKPRNASLDSGSQPHFLGRHLDSPFNYTTFAARVSGP